VNNQEWVNFQNLKAARSIPASFGKICAEVRGCRRPQLRQAALQLRHFLYHELPSAGGIPGPEDIALKKFGEALLIYIDFHAPPARTKTYKVTMGDPIHPGEGEG